MQLQCNSHSHSHTWGWGWGFWLFIYREYCVGFWLFLAVLFCYLGCVRARRLALHAPRAQEQVYLGPAVDPCVDRPRPRNKTSREATRYHLFTIDISPPPCIESAGYLFFAHSPSAQCTHACTTACTLPLAFVTASCIRHLLLPLLFHLKRHRSSTI